MKKTAFIKRTGEIVEIISDTSRICTNYGCGPMYVVKHENGQTSKIPFYLLKLPEQKVQTIDPKPLEFDKETADGLYRIFAGLSTSCYENAEVYSQAKPSMKKAYEKVIEWGRQNCKDTRGESLT